MFAFGAEKLLSSYISNLSDTLCLEEQQSYRRSFKFLNKQILNCYFYMKEENRENV